MQTKTILPILTHFFSLRDSETAYLWVRDYAFPLRETSAVTQNSMHAKHIFFIYTQAPVSKGVS